MLASSLPRRLPQRLTAAALDLVLPPRCPGCRDIVDAPNRFCAECWSSLSFITAPMCGICGLPFETGGARPLTEEIMCGDCAGTARPYDTARAALRYEGSAVPVLMGFKHAGRSHLAQLMADMMARHMPSHADLIVPIPLDRKRLARRGYNQAGLIARALSKRSRFELGIDTLKRIKPTASTAGLSRAARFRAAKGAFAVHRSLPQGLHIVLIDDVMTTGATIAAASRCLKRAGAARIDVLVFARAISA